MRVAKYACPQCGNECECVESKILEEDVCTSCGFFFMPGKCAGLLVVEEKDSMPPLPVAPPPKRPPARSVKTRRNVSAPSGAAPKRSSKPKYKSRPHRRKQTGSYINVVLATFALSFVPLVYIMNLAPPDARLFFSVILLIAWPIPALLVSWLAYEKGRKFWYWWIATWFLPGFNLLIFVSILVVERLVVCGSCGMRIPKDSRLCRYCGN